MKLKIKNKLYFVTCFLFLIGICKVVWEQKMILFEMEYSSITSQLVITYRFTESSIGIFTEQKFNTPLGIAVNNSNGNSDGKSTKAENDSESYEEMRLFCTTVSNNDNIAGISYRNILMQEKAHALPAVTIHQMGILRI